MDDESGTRALDTISIELPKETWEAILGAMRVPLSSAGREKVLAAYDALQEQIARKVEAA